MNEIQNAVESANGSVPLGAALWLGLVIVLGMVIVAGVRTWRWWRVEKARRARAAHPAGKGREPGMPLLGAAETVATLEAAHVEAEARRVGFDRDAWKE